MAEPIKKATLGGLVYNSNLATGRNLGNGQYEIKYNTGEILKYGEQKTRMAYFQSGERVSEQYVVKFFDKPLNEISAEALDENNFTVRQVTPEIEQTVHKGLIWDSTNFDIKEVMGATFTSSKDTVTTVNLQDSENCKIDLAANDSSYYADKANIKGGANNEVILDDEDAATIGDTHVCGRGTAAQKDYEK